MEQILHAYGLPKETIAAIMMPYSNRKVKVHSPDGNTDFFDIAAGVLQGDTFAPYLIVLRASIDLMKENGFTKSKKQTITRRNYYGRKQCRRHGDSYKYIDSS